LDVLIVTLNRSQGNFAQQAREQVMKFYRVSIKGIASLIMHRDNIEAAEALKRWREVPENKKKSVAGDDRSPAFGWLGCLYTDGRVVTIPTENIARALMEAGAQVVVPGGRSGKTFKAQSQSGMQPLETDWPLLVGGKEIPMEKLNELRTEEDFEVHKSVVQSLGFSLDQRRARIGTSKHIRVRPVFGIGWEASGVYSVSDEQITESVLRSILEIAGNYKGLCDWRPSSRTPGPFGRFEATLVEVDAAGKPVTKKGK